MTSENIHNIKLTDDRKLGSAVVETIQKKLDEPRYQRLFSKSQADARLFKVLYTLGYATLSGSIVYIHPKAKAYYKKYGEQYVECLEAALRLIEQ